MRLQLSLGRASDRHFAPEPFVVHLAAKLCRSSRPNHILPLRDASFPFRSGVYSSIWRAEQFGQAASHNLSRERQYAAARGSPPLSPPLTKQCTAELHKQREQAGTALAIEARTLQVIP